MIERQEIYCHECDRYVQFNLDLEIDGRHVLNCPNCGHQHYRIVERGRITDLRWGSASLPVVQVTGNITSTASSTWGTYSANTNATTGGASGYLYAAWSSSTGVTKA